MKQLVEILILLALLGIDGTLIYLYFVLFWR